ncbi:sulfotransferase family protein [uncultured Paraglaciecola sp.]|uniref:sulfotransferase family protein n=1 Tax=uncultured Paraglaciecola sp. TaxID=1765024 RepID=UPI002594D318|nr:sulfotransferase family protein [uncultured Paraglaciecola sp.]
MKNSNENKRLEQLNSIKGRLEYASWINLEKSFLYVETPKVACSTIKVILQELCEFDLPKNLMSIHYRNPKESFPQNIYECIESVDLIWSEEVFKFCFVREPATRLKSAFKDKVVNSQGKFWDKYRFAICSLNSLDNIQDITFEHFLNFVENTPDGSRDIHWRSQFQLLRPDIIPYDFIGKYEKFEADLSYVIGRLGIGNIHKYRSTQVNQSKDSLEERISNSQINRIQDIYKTDYQVFYD